MFIDLEQRNYPDYLYEGERDAEIINDPVLKDIIASARAGYTRGGERGLLKSLYAKQKEYYLAGKIAATMPSIERKECQGIAELPQKGKSKNITKRAGNQPFLMFSGDRR